MVVRYNLLGLTHAGQYQQRTSGIMNKLTSEPVESCHEPENHRSCCEDLVVDKPFFYADFVEALNLLESLDRPFFASGGWGLFAIRVGGFALKSRELLNRSVTTREGHSGYADSDMDFTLVFQSEEDAASKYTEIGKKCQKTEGIICPFNKDNNGSSVIWNRNKTFHFALWAGVPVPSNNESAAHIKILGIAGYNYLLPATRILPTRLAKFHDSVIPVANDYMWLYSHLRPYSNPAPKHEKDDDRSVEYGLGCLEMAYPKFLHQAAGVPEHVPIKDSVDYYDFVRELEKSLVLCALCLERQGCASFASCFRD